MSLRSIALAWLCLTLLPLAGARAQEASTSLYIRNDSDRTTVVTPRLRVAAPLTEETTVDVTYTVDVWTSASIDIRTSASKVVNQQQDQKALGEQQDEQKPVIEQRDQIDVGVAQVLGDGTLSAAYRYSSEPDYLSNGGSLGLSYDFADRSSTVGLGLSAFFDDVGRAGDPGFSRDLRTLSARASFTQVIDPKMFLLLIYEFGRSEGFLSSPYRYIGIGTKDGACGGPLQAIDPMQPVYCLLEQSPNTRQRHAGSLTLRRALFDALSAGVGYRFYTDDWELLSHTIEADLALLAGADTMLKLRYRFYTQNAAKHYAERFPTIAAAGRYFTHDKELSTLTVHRIGLDFEQHLALDEDGDDLRLVASVGPSFYTYADFPPLSSINAFEATLSLVLEL